MAWPVSEDYQTVIAGPHRVQRVADVIVGGTVAYRDLPVTGGRITVDSRQRVRRQCSLTITPTLPIGAYEVRGALATTLTGIDATHPLRWTGPEIRIRHGVTFPDGLVEWIPAGVFRIDSGMGSLLEDQPVQATGASRESWLIDDNRDGGTYTTTGGLATSLIRARILATAADAQVLISTRRDRVVPASSADDADAWATVERLARSIGAVAYCDADGRFIVTDQPSKDSQPVALLKPGADGTLVSAHGGGSRTDVVTGVSVTGATPTGASAPVWAVAYNDDVTSPTRRGDPSAGMFGWRVLQMTDGSLTSPDDCHRMAVAELAKRSGVATGVDLTAVPMPHLEALDVIDVATDPERIAQSVSRHVVDAYTLDLAPGGAFPVTTRDLGLVVV